MKEWLVYSTSLLLLFLLVLLLVLWRRKPNKKAKSQGEKGRRKEEAAGFFHNIVNFSSYSFFAEKKNWEPSSAIERLPFSRLHCQERSENNKNSSNRPCRPSMQCNLTISVIPLPVRRLRMA